LKKIYFELSRGGDLKPSKEEGFQVPIILGGTSKPQTKHMEKELIFHFSIPNTPNLPKNVI